MYYTPANDNKIELETGSDEDESSDVSDDETVITESGFGDNIYDDLESGDIEEDEVIDDTTTSTMISASSQLSMNQSRKKFLTGSAVKKRRLRVGPPQNSDVAGRKIPPQVHLKRVENILHKISLSISVEHVDSPQEQLTEVKSALATTNDAVQAAEKRMRKLVQDEFDKLLGMQSKGSNPIHRIMGTFLGPLMRMIRIIVFIIRIAFNISTWRDPYLSFWVSVGLCVLFFILIIFPWKAFFTLATLIGLGPQVRDLKVMLLHIRSSSLTFTGRIFYYEIIWRRKLWRNKKKILKLNCTSKISMRLGYQCRRMLIAHSTPCLVFLLWTVQQK